MTEKRSKLRIKYISLQPRLTNTKEINIMNVNEIPKELLSRIRQQFDNDPKVGQLRVRQQNLQRSGRYEEALVLAKEIETLYDKVIYEYIEESKRQVEKVDVANMDIPLEDKEKMMQLLLCCFMCADMIRAAVIDMDDILHKYDENLHIEMFNDIKQVMEMSEEKLKFLQRNSGYLKDLVWGQKCDNMYELLQSKAKAIMNKRKNNPNWGKNMEKFY